MDDERTYGSVEIMTGSSCNMNCMFCLSGAGSARGDCSFDDLRRKIIESRKYSDSLCFNGGEPTIRKDILRLVKLAKFVGYERIAIQTNGLMLSDRRFVERLADSGANSLHILGISSKKDAYESLSRFPGSFDLHVRGIRNVVDRGIPVEIDVVINKRNYRELSGMVVFFSGLGVRKVNLKFVCIGGNSKRNLGIVPRMGLAAPHVMKCLDAARKNGIDMNCQYMPYCLLSGYEEHVMGVGDADILIVDSDSSYPLADGISRICTKTGACAGCAYNDDCFGIDKSYLSIFGGGEISPVKGCFKDGQAGQSNGNEKMIKDLTGMHHEI